MNIHPSLLAVPPSQFPIAIESIESSYTTSIHFDIGDGVFVPSFMLDISLLATIPDNIAVDVHLMTQYPSTYFSQVLDYTNVNAVAFHIESAEDIRENISFLRQKGKKVGLALLSSTPVDHIYHYLLEIDYILVMTVKGGFSGTPFIPEVMDKIAEIHRKNPEVSIVVDGGINLETAQLCANAGATGAVVSSALFGQQDRKQYLRLLAEIEQK